MVGFNVAVSLSLVASAWECPFEGIELSRVEVEKACEIRCNNGLGFARKMDGRQTWTVQDSFLFAESGYLDMHMRTFGFTVIFTLKFP